MARALDRDKLLTAFDDIGRAAAAASTTLQIVVYGGSALMLASNFRFATEDADVAPLEKPWPEWLQRAVERITAETGWAEDWFNDGVAFHLSPIADHAVDHLEFGTFPRDGTPPGLIVYVPSASYLLALKLKAIRITDPLRGEQERLDILNLMRVVGIRTIDEAIVVLARYFPASGASAEKQRFLLKHTSKERSMRPSTLAEAVERVRAGVSQDVSMAEFVDSFLLAPDKGARFAAIEREPEFSGDLRLDALVAAVAEYLAKQYRLGRVPAWASQPRRCLDEPWFTTSSASPAMREYLSVVSPAEFRSHNIFTEERPLRRARSHLPYLSEARASSDLA